MRPVFIRFQCFGPYMKEQCIDFEQLNDKGIFLVCGETGAGKTTILDAMCYALYGESSNGERGTLKDMRCKRASVQDRTIVEFTFASGARTYRFVRILRYGTKNMIEEQNCMEYQEGEYVPVCANPTATFVKRQAEAVIGLNAAQFRQVVLLPQGKFEQFLVSDSGEKEKVLTTIFHAQRWAEITKIIKEKVEGQIRELEEKKQEAAVLLEQQECQDAEELESRIAELDMQEKQFCKELETIRQKKESACGKYEKALSENPDFLELEKRKKELEEFIKMQEQMEAERQTIQRADAALDLLPVYEQDTAAREACDALKEAKEQAQQTFNSAKEEEHMFDDKKAVHEAKRGMYEEKRELQIRLKAAEPVYRELEEKKAALQAVQEEVKGLRTEYEHAGEEYEERCRAWEACKARQDQEMQRYQEANARYIRNAAGRLSEGLEEGRPCPVCGSISHPHLAVCESGELISEEELERRNAAMTKAGTDVTKAWNRVTEINTAREMKKEQLAAKRELLSNAQAEFDSIVRHKIDAVESLEQWQAKVQETEEWIGGFDGEESRIAEQEGLMIRQMTTAKQALEEKAKAYESAQEKADKSHAGWLSALAEKGFDTEEEFLAVSMERRELDARKEELTRYEHGLRESNRRLEEQQRRLAGREAPKLQELKREMEEAENIFLDKSKAYAALVHERQSRKKASGKLQMMQEAYQQQKLVVESNQEFVRKLLPKSGISLQTYVLGIMLTSVTAAANRLLWNVHGGRYQLFRTNEGISAHKAGLELEILDHSNGQRRSVKTLSGGEKFLVALSLAIGLSTVVQTQNSDGLRLEAMFIDEGFGSLDQSSIGDALDVLTHIQNSHGLVGIISHIERLKETIPVQLEIIKEKEGSVIREHM